MNILTVYLDEPGELLKKGVSELARAIMEAWIEAEESTDPFIEGYIQLGRELGYDQVRRECEHGREWMLQHPAENKALDILKLIELRKLALTEEQRSLVTAEAGLEKLGRWRSRVLTAETAEVIFREDRDMPNGDPVPRKEEMDD